MIRRLCVYCASNDGIRPEYLKAARRFGKVLAEQEIALVFGGGRVGLMGALAEGVLNGGGEAIGIMPHGLVQREVAHNGLTALHIVDTMHERKALMAELSDAFVALPGGLGTLEELFETWTWAQLGVHAKPVALLDVEGFWAPFTKFLDHVEREGFMRGTPRDMLVIDDDGNRLIEKLHAYEPPAARRWLRLGET